MGGNKIAPNPTLTQTNPDAYLGMGMTAELVAQKYGINREDADAFALASHQKAVAAIDAGPLQGRDRAASTSGATGRPASFDTRRGPAPRHEPRGRSPPCARPSRPRASSPPATRRRCPTAPPPRSSSPRRRRRSLGLRPLARLVTYAVAGVPPEIMGIGPVEAVPKALKQAGLTLADIDLIELNEAFATQALAVIRGLGLDPGRRSTSTAAPSPSAIPSGCTGAKLTAPAPPRDGSAASSATASSRCASAAAWARPGSSNGCSRPQGWKRHHRVTEAHREKKSTNNGREGHHGDTETTEEEATSRGQRLVLERVAQGLTPHRQIRGEQRRPLRAPERGLPTVGLRVGSGEVRLVPERVGSWRLRNAPCSASPAAVTRPRPLDAARQAGRRRAGRTPSGPGRGGRRRPEVERRGAEVLPFLRAGRRRGSASRRRRRSGCSPGSRGSAARALLAALVQLAQVVGLADAVVDDVPRQDLVAAAAPEQVEGGVEARRPSCRASGRRRPRAASSRASATRRSASARIDW